MNTTDPYPDQATRARAYDLLATSACRPERRQALAVLFDACPVDDPGHSSWDIYMRAREFRPKVGF